MIAYDMIIYNNNIIFNIIYPITDRKWHKMCAPNCVLCLSLYLSMDLDKCVRVFVILIRFKLYCTGLFESAFGHSSINFLMTGCMGYGMQMKFWASAWAALWICYLNLLLEIGFEYFQL